MNFEDAIALAKKLAQQHGTIAYVHTEPDGTFNLRFVAMIEECPEAGIRRTVAILKPNGEELRLAYMIHDELVFERAT